MRHPEKHIPDLWVDIDIFTDRHLLSGWVAAIKDSKIDYNGNKKTPLWNDGNRKLYPVTGHSNPGSFVITFSSEKDAMEYNSAIKSFGERKRSEDFLTPEVWFGFQDEEGYNLYIEISHGLMDCSKTTPTRF